MIVAINPNLLILRKDPLTTGIVYMPIGLAYILSAIRLAGIRLKVIDAFGEKPRQCAIRNKYMVCGLTEEEVVREIDDSTKVVFIYANQLINHDSVVGILKASKEKYPDTPVCVLENSQAVTAYSLSSIAANLFEVGADYMLTGDIESSIIAFIDAVTKCEDVSRVPGAIGIDFDNSGGVSSKKTDELPLPAWDLFPLENYWRLRFSHGPLSSKRYLPILTSRGCPYPCKFCVVPETNQRKWRARTANAVVDEIEFSRDRFGVSEFHIEDLNPTVNDKRIREICREILDRKLKIVWKIVAGTKIETIKNEETLELMAKAGCKYISISPESGSKDVLKLIDKPFDLDHAVAMIQAMNRFGIYSQACFVLGFPGEKEEDRRKTRAMVKDITRGGIDEIALFIVSPVPGSKLFREFSGYRSLSDLNFTPTWREDYSVLNKFRIRLYRSFLWWKIKYHPVEVSMQALRFLARKFETKMEMVPYKALVWKALELRASRAGRSS